MPHSCTVSIKITPHNINANPTTFAFFIKKTIKRPVSLITIISIETSTASAKTIPKIGIIFRKSIKNLLHYHIMYLCIYYSNITKQ